MDKDLYSVLGVEKNASEDEIKKAYRRIAQKNHPDKNPGDKESEKRFKEATVAYETLGDAQKRKQYDMFGNAGQNGFGGGGFSGSPFENGNVDFGDMGGFSDIFESFFGGQGQRSSKRKNGPRRGNDIESVVNIEFTEAFHGTSKDIALTKPVVCDDCNGKRVAKNSKMTTCPTCKGQGSVRKVQQTILGSIATQAVCQSCRGIGEFPEKECSTCRGEGRISKKETITVKIPAGVDNGAVVRVDGKGEGGLEGGSYGDLFLHIKVKPHTHFTRNDKDVLMSVKIHVLQAILGDEITVDTLHGNVSLRIPAGTTHGKRFKLAGYGMPDLRHKDNFGDQIVEVHIDIPHKLSHKEEESYEALASQAGLNIKRKKGLFG